MKYYGLDEPNELDEFDEPEENQWVYLEHEIIEQNDPNAVCENNYNLNPIYENNRNYELDAKINVSIVMADQIQQENKVRSFDGYEINLDTYLQPNEYTLYAIVNHDRCYARKTRDGLIQYYYDSIRDHFTWNDFFSEFIKDYVQVF